MCNVRISTYRNAMPGYNDKLLKYNNIMPKYNDMKSYYSDKMFHYIDTMLSYNGCSLSIMIRYQNLVKIYETIITEVKQTGYNGNSVAYNLT